MPRVLNSRMLISAASAAAFAVLVGFAPAVQAQTTDSSTPSTGSAGTPAATSPLQPTAEVPVTDIPFYSDWAGSAHADHSALAFNHWNSEGSIPVECARCHSTPGYRDFLGADGSAVGVVNNPAPVGTVITCMACHNPKTLTLSEVTFPSGVMVAHLGPEARCMVCHQGRESSDSVTAAVKDMADDTVSAKLQFINVHYLAAAATQMGSIVRGAYQYPGKTYVGLRKHPDPYTTCIACHDMHTALVRVDDCSACHKEVTNTASLKLIRDSADKTDYDGDGNISEGIAAEVVGMQKRLYAAIQAYGASVAGKPIIYDPDAYPYFFVDTNANGIADPDELKYPNKYNAWTPRLLKAAYNYQFTVKDPGGYAHNALYMLQILFDSTADLGTRAKAPLDGAIRP